MWLLKFTVFSLYLLITCASPTVNRIEQLDEPLSFRLPNHTTPLSYDITLTTNIHQNDFNFTGNVKIHLKVLVQTSSITLHYRQIAIDKIDVYLPGSSTPIHSDPLYLPVESHDFLQISLPTLYDIDDELIVDISYHGWLREDAGGFYRGQYINSEGITKSYAATQFLIDNARHAFPCYDEPGYRAVMQLTLIHGKSYTAISNTEILLQTENGDNFVTKFVPTPAMQTYTMAFIIFDYGYVNATGNSRIPQRIYAKADEIQQGKANFAASIVGDILEKFESLFEVKYPLNKMDHAAVSYVGQYAMENFGLIIYHPSAILLDQNLSSGVRIQSEEAITSLISHEYAHQWFGNTVSPKWWQYSWLSIGMAKFFEVYIMDLLHIEQDRFNRDFLDVRSRAFHSDQLGSWALNQYTDDPSMLWHKFDEISSFKAACVLRMFMEFLEEDVFLNGLNIYLKDNYMKAASPDDLHAAFNTAFDQKHGAFANIEKLMSTWENQPGYPLISIGISGNSLVFSQRRYPESNGELYAVPITLATKTNPNFNSKMTKVLLDTQTMSVSQSSLGFTPNDWIVLNNEQVGYYRVDYDSTLWRAIINQLNDNHEVINTINRASLMYEYYLGWTELNRVTASNGLEILSYFDKETESIVWSKAQQTFMDFNGYLFGTAAYPNYLLMLQTITRPHLNQTGYDDIDGEDMEITRLRSFTRHLNCQALDGNCLSRDNVRLTLYRMGVGDANFNFCNAMRVVPNATFLQILNDVITNTNLNSRFEYVTSMGCSLLDQNLEALLEAVLNPNNGLNTYDREMFLFGMTYSSNLALEMTVNFIDDNYSALFEVTTIFYSSLYNIAVGVKEQVMVSKFRNILNRMLSDGKITQDDRDFYFDLMRANQEWMDNNYYDILVFFGLEEGTTTTTTTIQPSEEPTTTPLPTTTEPDSATSVVLSVGLTFVCLLINFFTN